MSGIRIEALDKNYRAAVETAVRGGVARARAAASTSFRPAMPDTPPMRRPVTAP